MMASGQKAQSSYCSTAWSVIPVTKMCIAQPLTWDNVVHITRLDGQSQEERICHPSNQLANSWARTRTLTYARQQAPLRTAACLARQNDQRIHLQNVASSAKGCTNYVAGQFDSDSTRYAVMIVTDRQMPMNQHLFRTVATEGRPCCPAIVGR